MLKFLQKQELNETGIYSDEKCFWKAMPSTNPKRFLVDVYGRKIYLPRVNFCKENSLLWELILPIASLLEYIITQIISRQQYINP